MTSEQLSHVLRAAGDLTGHDQFVLVGSTAILAWYDDQVVPTSMARSREADLFASNVSEDEAERMSDLLENIGQLLDFDETFGYYADGVGPHTAVLPVDWRDRSKVYEPLGANGVVAIVPHPDDIALAKLCAGREKDVDWVRAAHASDLIDLDSVAARVEKLPGRTLGQIEAIRVLIAGARRAHGES